MSKFCKPYSYNYTPQESINIRVNYLFELLETPKKHHIIVYLLFCFFFNSKYTLKQIPKNKSREILYLIPNDKGDDLKTNTSKSETAAVIPIIDFIIFNTN